MSVNISKTKVLIFNKSGRFIKQKFILNNKVLDNEYVIYPAQGSTDDSLE
jgi:hypothetical protein